MVGRLLVEAGLQQGILGRDLVQSRQARPGE